MNKNQRLKYILILMSNFVERKISGKEFEKKYIEVWRDIRDNSLYYQVKIQRILDELFSDVDAFESDKNLLKQLRDDMKKDGYAKKQIDKMYTDEEGLRKWVKIKLRNMNKILKET